MFQSNFRLIAVFSTSIDYKHHTAIPCDLLFADDCALLAYSHDVAQQLLDYFSRTAHRFGLPISLKKTVVMLQSENLQSYTTPAVIAGDSY